MSCFRKKSDALHLWCVVTLLEFVKTPGSLMYRSPVLLSVPDYKNERNVVQELNQ